MVKALITFPHYKNNCDDEVFTMELPDNTCFREPEPGLKYEAEIQIGFIRNNIKLLYGSLRQDREVCNVKFDFELPQQEPWYQIRDSDNREVFFTGTQSTCERWLFNKYFHGMGEFEIIPTLGITFTKTKYELPIKSKYEEIFELPDHLKSKRVGWITDDINRKMSNYYKNGI